MSSLVLLFSLYQLFKNTTTTNNSYNQYIYIYNDIQIMWYNNIKYYVVSHSKYIYIIYNEYKIYYKHSDNKLLI